jgi:hypothetical protein
VLNILTAVLLLVAVAAAGLGWMNAVNQGKAVRSLESDRRLLERQLAETQKQLIQTQQKLSEKSRVPFTVTYRNALTGPGYVCVFTNRSDRALTVVATFENPTLKKTTTKTILLKPSELSEVGYAEGWAFSSGDTITLKNADYADLLIHIP